MHDEMQILLLTAVAISFLHTLAGPDHYLPFVALAKSRGWSVRRTMYWTILCGCGHVGSSVVLGLVGAAIGWSMSSMHWMESVRGGLAGWIMLGFGTIYFIWGWLRARRNKAHKHFDINDDGAVYVYEHRHGQSIRSGDRHRVTPWVLFLIFVLGPCEPMLPLLYFPAARSSAWGMTGLILVYTFFTIATMMVMVLLGYYGLRFFNMAKLERYMHALGGLTISVCGSGMVFMNW